VFAGLNVLGSKVTGRAETAIVALQAVILLALVVLGLFKADPEVISQSAAPSVMGVIVAGALLFNTYQGFGVVTNAAGEMSDPRRQLPRAMFAALIIVGAFYLAISSVLVATVPAERIVADSGHVLADFGDIVAGHAGFVVISVAALLAAASAVNATIFAASNVGYEMAEKREMSRSLTRTVWRGTSWSLVVSSAIVVLLVLFFPLQAVGSMTSLAFLVLYGAVNAGHLRLRRTTGARAWPLVAGVVVNALLFVALLGNAISQGQTSTWVALIAFVIGSFAFEAAFRAHERRHAQAGP
jgi:amino acid transporter